MNRLVSKFLVVIGVWLAFVGHTFASAPIDDLLKEANDLYNQYKDSEALVKYQLVLLDNPEQYEALYKASLLESRIGARYSDETEKIQHFTSAKVYAESALQVKPNGADSHYAMALAITNLSLVSGPKDRLVNLSSIKDHVDKALLFNPAHAAAWQLLGRWHYKVANLNFLEVTAAKFFTGEIPKGANNYKAIEALKKSIVQDPLNISGFYDLAIIYKDTKQIEQSILVLQEAIKLNLITSEDLEISRRCKALLQEIGDKVVVKAPAITSTPANI